MTARYPSVNTPNLWVIVLIPQLESGISCEEKKGISNNGITAFPWDNNCPSGVTEILYLYFPFVMPKIKREHTDASRQDVTGFVISSWKKSLAWNDAYKQTSTGKRWKKTSKRSRVLSLADCVESFQETMQLGGSKPSPQRQRWALGQALDFQKEVWEKRERHGSQ